MGPKLLWDSVGSVRVSLFIGSVYIKEAGASKKIPCAASYKHKLSIKIFL
jgi:hypothetical protein